MLSYKTLQPGMKGDDGIKEGLDAPAFPGEVLVLKVDGEIADHLGEATDPFRGKKRSQGGLTLGLDILEFAGSPCCHTGLVDRVAEFVQRSGIRYAS